MVFLTESWFWRGTQSAIFYYVACTPWVEHKHNRKRRKEAAKAREEKENSTIYTQPGVVIQPDPFQTNEEWAQEIVQGPGPPKGWKRDSIYYKYVRKFQAKDTGDMQLRTRGVTVNSTESPAKSVFTGITDASTAVEPIQEAQEAQEVHLDANYRTSDTVAIKPGSHRSVNGGNGSLNQIVSPHSSNFDRQIGDDLAPNPKASSVGETATTGSKRSSFESVSTVERRPSGPTRPSMEKRLSTAMDGFKDAMRTAIHPDHWNWIRYDRDDEILSNINVRMKGVWDSVKEHMTFPPEQQSSKLIQTQAQAQAQAEAASMENEVKKWQRGTHPAVNDLSPPIVSQLPSTREEAQWMLLPPASADVMMGRARPDFFDDINRKPLCIIGRPTPKMPSPVNKLSPVSSDDEGAESSESEEELWPAGFTHVQKPQRAYLYKRRASYGFELPLTPNP